MATEDKSLEIEVLQQTLLDSPNLWEIRKKTAKLLFDAKRFLEAADLVWGAPEIPPTDVDIAFSISMLAREKPNRAIRMLYEVIRKNHDKPEQNMAIAKALNDLGLYMEAARFYGAALARNSALFDLGFENQMLWLDDSGKLIEAWRESDQDSKPPLDVESQKIHVHLKPASIPKDTVAEAVRDSGATALHPAIPGGPPAVTLPKPSPTSAHVPIPVPKPVTLNPHTSAHAPQVNQPMQSASIPRVTANPMPAALPPGPPKPFAAPAPSQVAPQASPASPAPRKKNKLPPLSQPTPLSPPPPSE